jgi:peptidoglycan-associated lipoprotein
MISKFARTFLFGALSVALVTSCRSKEQKPDATAPAAGAEKSATDSPQIANKDINFDPAGSDSGKISGLSTVFFEYDKASLTSESRKTLADNAQWIKSNPSVTVQIEGHTDDRGSVEYNLALGERRAKSVKGYLTSLGIDGKRLTVISYGKEKPIAQGDTDAAWSKNRRANFVPLAQ